MASYIYNKVKRWSLGCVLMALTTLMPSVARAQVGEYRTDLAFGVNGGYMLTDVGFVPEVPQKMMGGLTGGLTIRYTCEKYFKSICAIVAEVNYSQMGWKEEILDADDNPVINGETGLAEAYSRRISYVQVPVFARLGWGRERSGMQFFFQIGPQLGFYLNESADANFNLDNPNVYERSSHISGPTVEGYAFSNMYHMPVENKLDYGIAGGFGLEYSHRKLGHFLLEGRYYYGLGNIYGNTKRDYFAKSNHGAIVVKMSYLFDVLRTKNGNIK